jgi:hypothetical protein
LQLWPTVPRQSWAYARLLRSAARPQRCRRISFTGTFACALAYVYMLLLLYLSGFFLQGLCILRVSTE